MNSAKPPSGSRRLCHEIAGLPDHEAAAWLNSIAAPAGAVVGPDDIRVPRGGEKPRTVHVDDDNGLLPAEMREALREWWLARRAGAKTPDWDIAATCTIGSARGLILVEGIAHAAELSAAGKPEALTPYGQANHGRVAVAMHEANRALNSALHGWRLSRDHHYRISQRFAWAWKIASLRVPVALVYLGFLNADDVSDRGTPFANARAWELQLLTVTNGIVPAQVWGNILEVNGTPMCPIIAAR